MPAQNLWELVLYALLLLLPLLAIGFMVLGLAMVRPAVQPVSSDRAHRPEGRPTDGSGH